MNDDSRGSGGRWWEIRGAAKPDDDDGYRELMTDSRGRSRPERSLSVGADLAEEPHHAARTFLWSIGSAVAAVGLIVAVVYLLSPTKPSRGGDVVVALPAPQSSAPGNPEPPPPGGGSRPARPPAPAPDRPPSGPPAQAPAWPGPPPGAGDGPRPPDRPPADAPRSPAVPPGGPPSSPGPEDPPGDAGGDSSNQQTRTPAPNAPPPSQASQDAPVKLDEPVPAAPSSARVRTLKSDTGGGCAKSNNTDYVCTITREAPYYLPGTTEPSSHLASNQIPWFRCQSAGPKYPGANGANHWWAWLTPPAVMGISTSGWIPVVFLKGAPSADKPIPGLPLCDGATESTKSTGSASATSTQRP